MRSLTFDPSLPVQTRDGRPARIICKDAKGEQPIIGLVVAQDGCGENMHRYALSGRYFHHSDDPSTSHLDLINIPKRIEGWVNIYVSPSQIPGVVYMGSLVFQDRHAADAHLNGCARVACIHVSLAEGEGLS